MSGLQDQARSSIFLDVIALKMIKYLPIILICLSCSQEKASNNNISSSIDSTDLALSTKLLNDTLDNKDINELVIEVKENESFNEFFEKFKNDSAFQISRTDFPFNIFAVDLEENMTIDSIEKTDWKFLNLTYDSSYYYREVDAYQIIIGTTEDSATLHFGGVNNGIYFTYIFYNRSDKWVLNRLEDYSN